MKLSDPKPVIRCETCGAMLRTTPPACAAPLCATIRDLRQRVERLERQAAGMPRSEAPIRPR